MRPQRYMSSSIFTPFAGRLCLRPARSTPLPSSSPREGSQRAARRCNPHTSAESSTASRRGHVSGSSSLSSPRTLGLWRRKDGRCSREDERCSREEVRCSREEDRCSREDERCSLDGGPRSCVERRSEDGCRSLREGAAFVGFAVDGSVAVEDDPRLGSLGVCMLGSVDGGISDSCTLARGSSSSTSASRAAKAPKAAYLKSTLLTSYFETTEEVTHLPPPGARPTKCA